MFNINFNINFHSLNAILQFLTFVFDSLCGKYYYMRGGLAKFACLAV